MATLLTPMERAEQIVSEKIFKRVHKELPYVVSQVRGCCVQRRHVPDPLLPRGSDGQGAAIGLKCSHGRMSGGSMCLVAA